MITKPTLLLDETRCRHNIERMAQKAQRHGLQFRPHFKTHQSLEIGRWFKDYGVNRITVSSLDMATYFAAEWSDITVAFPTNILEIGTINRLAANIQLQLVVESVETIRYLAQSLTQTVGIFLKIDVGYHRTGIAPDAVGTIDAILAELRKSVHLSFAGFLAHAGHTYNCRSKAEIIQIHERARQLLVGLAQRYRPRYPNLLVSYGDTPSCSVADTYGGIDEIRPGNFVFYDLTQALIGSNPLSMVAVALACPIVAVHPQRQELVLYGGGVHFSKDRLEDPEYGTIYGKVAAPKGNGWMGLIEGMYVKGLSQEHGIVHLPPDQLQSYQVGDYLMVLPVHSCMTANAMNEYQLLSGRQLSRL